MHNMYKQRFWKANHKKKSRMIKIILYNFLDLMIPPLNNRNIFHYDTFNIAKIHSMNLVNPKRITIPELISIV